MWKQRSIQVSNYNNSAKQNSCIVPKEKHYLKKNTLYHLFLHTQA